MGNNLKKIRKTDINTVYDIKDTLGSGSFAVVKRASRKADGKEFAIKTIKKDKLNREELQVVHDEVTIMHKIAHPHCVQLFEIFETSKKLYMVLELLTGGELFDRIVAKGSFNEREASGLIKAITSAIDYLHTIGVVHRDLKPENLIYLSPDNSSPIKITDFGLAKYRGKLPDNQFFMKTACGTPGYVAPEVLKNEPYTKAVDMWSLGVILYILLCGFPPFYHENTAQLYKQIKRGEYDFPSPYWNEISDPAKDLVRSLLCVDPNKRFSAKQVLAHPWIAGGAAPVKSLGAGYSKRLMLLQAKRRFRKSIQTVIALNRFCSVMRMLASNDPSIVAMMASNGLPTGSSPRASASAPGFNPASSAVGAASSARRTHA